LILPVSVLRDRYPDAPRSHTVDRLHGVLVPDPYRWLEDRDDQCTRDWLAAQDEFCARQLADLAGRNRLVARLTQLYDVGAVDPPVWRGQRWFATRREPRRELNALYTGQCGDDGRVLIDPQGLDPSGHTVLEDWVPDHQGRLLVYRVSSDGAEEPMLWVVNVESGQIVDGPIDRTRHGSVAWLPDGSAFYYTRRLHPVAVPAGEEQYHRRVYLHQVGSPATSDAMVFGEGRDKLDLYRPSIGPDGRWLIVRCSRGTAPRDELWIADLHRGSPDGPELHAVQEGLDAKANARIGPDGRLYLFTNLDAPRCRLAVADLTDPCRLMWTELLPEDTESVLTDYALVYGHPDRLVVLAARTRNAVGELTTHDGRTGERLDTIELPGLGTVSGFSEHPDGTNAWFGYTDFRTPRTVMRYNAQSRMVDTWWQPPGRFASPAVDVRRLECRSTDGTRVGMLVASSGAPTERAAVHPTILYGYGGFNVSLTPAYSPAALAWVEAGGTYVIAGLRGGGEEGADWHRAGPRESKQNTFDDFVAAAESLIADGWTSAECLCVSGGSNGGLLVGAAVTQRPELFAAALCKAPLLDMLRYERSGLGPMWTEEYGCADDPKQFGWLLAYSPYHHVRAGTRYPATLFATADGDTRVDPMHAWKMCAAMQHAASTPDRPVVLRREAHVGHGTRAVSREIALSADMLAFAATHTGLQL
jgi:prolyl oligopeptidase